MKRLHKTGLLQFDQTSFNKIVRFTARAIGSALDQVTAAGMAGKRLTAVALGSLLAGAAIFVLLSPDSPSKANVDGVTIQGQPTALSISSKAAFAQCLLTLNSKFTAPAELAVGETLVPWSRFVREQDVRFNPEVDGFGTLMIDCLAPVHGVGLFRFKR